MKLQLIRWGLFQSILHLFTLSAFSQVIYVKWNATGDNDGTSWENAYIDLQEAIDLANENDTIWIAKGTYHPGNFSPDTNSFFTIQRKAALFGGFDGTETSFDQRNVQLNEVVLSGDLNNDDAEGEYTLYKSDNTLHVIYVESPDMIILDGLTIKGGHAVDNENAPQLQKSGGGIYALSPVSIRNSTITGNYARTGAGLFLDNGARNSEITNTSFHHNRSNSRSAGIYANRLDGLKIKTCAFNNNQTSRGLIYPFHSSNVLIEDCLFENNDANTANGGGIFSFQNRRMRIRGCNFISNSANIGGAIVVNGSELPPDTLSNIVIENCHFENNESDDSAGAIYCNSNPDITISHSAFVNNTGKFAGAVYIEQALENQSDTSRIRIDSCTFIYNSSENIAGALRFRNSSAKVENSVFENNSTQGFLDGGGGHILILSPGQQVVFRNSIFKSGESGGFAGAVAAYGSDAHYLFDNCVFEENIANRLGGAMHIINANTTIQNSIFRKNSTETGGGAVSLYDSATLYTHQSIFKGNHALGNGGALFANSGGIAIVIDECVLDSNYSATGYAGAIMMTETTENESVTLSIVNSILSFNHALDDGGAIYVEDVDAEIISSLFYQNYCEDPTSGGVITNKVTGNDTAETLIVNSTFADNFAYLGCLIQEEETDGLLTTYLQNNIFRNSGTYDYFGQIGFPTVISRGGNMSGDESMFDILIDSSDLIQTEPLFNNSGLFDFSLRPESPGIDAGIELDAPTTDILGNPRVNAPDMGAYENQFPVNTKEILTENGGQFWLFPNPVGNEGMQLSLWNDWMGDLEIVVFDATGIIVFELVSKKVSAKFEEMIPELNIAPGYYKVFIRNGANAIGESLIKL